MQFTRFFEHLAVPITKKERYFLLIPIFKMMNESLNHTIFGKKEKSTRLFNVNSTIKYTVNWVFFVKCIIGKRQIVSTSGADVLLSSV